MEKKDNSHFTYGLIIGIILILFSIIATITPLWHHYILIPFIIPLLIFMVGVIISCISYSNKLNGNMVFGKIFNMGFKTSLIATFLIVLWSILQKYVFPEMLEKQIQYMITVMHEKGYGDDIINKSVENTRHPNIAMQISFGIFFFAIFGCLASLIGAAVAKKNPQANNPFGQ